MYLSFFRQYLVSLVANNEMDTHVVFQTSIQALNEEDSYKQARRTFINLVRSRGTSICVKVNKDDSISRLADAFSPDECRELMKCFSNNSVTCVLAFKSPDIPFFEFRSVDPDCADECMDDWLEAQGCAGLGRVRWKIEDLSQIPVMDSVFA